MAFRTHQARAPSVLLSQSKPLKAIAGHAKHLAYLQHLLESQLQPAAREHCRIASWRENSLLLIVTDGHWATRLRYQQKRLQRHLQTFNEFANLTRILFRVQPPTVSPKVSGHTLKLSVKAAQTIQATADEISDPALRTALEQLASNAKPKSQE